MVEMSKPLQLKRDGKKITIIIECNSEEHAAKMYNQMIEMAAKGVAIKLTLQGTGIGAMDV
jgi:hypothetical protein